ncbi:hypothetical protein GJ744_004115 [Endocarpon pusillum]|uniref:Uncharacterized protein n=1 Tax=Endocarpon pusillum TaxID=364733 RepID=A0A8H7E6W0_9EURO|nr:hypothetical protein GJ744_004115 [Endocarpon pusillum]
MAMRTDWDLPVDDSDHVQQDNMYDELLGFASSGGENKRTTTVAARGRTPGVTRETQEKNTGGAATNLYKEMREVTKRGDAMT